MYLPNGNVLFNTSRIHYKMLCGCSGYGSSLILIKGCGLSVRAVVAYVVEYFVLNFVLVFVSILVVSSCKDSCNVLCNMCCNNTLMVCLLLLNDISKKYI